MKLRVRTRRVDGDVDLLDVAGRHGWLFEQGGVGLAGRGGGLRLDVADAAAVLAGAEVDDEVGVPGSGAVAFGALPFRAERAATVVVPDVVVGRDRDGNRWVTT